MVPPEVAGQMIQLNLRVDAQDKRQAEEVLRLMGTTTTKFMRKVLAKIARGAKDYAEVMEALEKTPERVPEAAIEEGRDLAPITLEATRICNDFARMLGYASVGELPKDDRSYEEVYEEAMLDHYREKGWLS